MFVVSGVTGNTGSVVAQTLLDQGQPVRVIVRSAEKGAPWAAKGAEVAVADLLDQASLVAALKGAKGAYFLLPPDLASETFVEDSRTRADTIVAAAKEARLPHAVVLSSVGAQYEERVGPIVTVGYLERSFVVAGIPVTAVRPGYFLENILEMVPAAIHQGIYPSMIQPLDLKIDMVATRDIGGTLADALLDSPSIPHRVIELKGADQYSAQDIAAALSKKLGRNITPVPVPQDAWVPTLTEVGLSSQSAGLMAEMHENINNGRIAFVDPNARKASIDLTSFVEQLSA